MWKQQRRLKKTSVVENVEKATAVESKLISNPKNPTGTAKSTSPTFRVEPKKFRRLSAEDARVDETDLDGSPLELAACTAINMLQSRCSPYRQVSTRG